MEADVVVAKAAVNLAGDEVLSGVLLHEVEAVGPVQCAVYRLPDRDGGGAEVGGLPGLKLGIEDGNGSAVIGQRPPVAGLAAALREEGGLVQRYGEAAAAQRLAGGDGGGEVGTHGVFVI